MRTFTRLRAAAAAVPVAIIASVFVTGPTANAAYPGENGEIFWASSATLAPEADIWMATTSGTPVNLTSSPDVDDTYPAVSADGEWLAFSSDRNSAGDLDLFLMEISSGDVSPLTSSGSPEGWAAFSPDGTELAYAEQNTTTFAWTVKVLDLGTADVRTVGAGWHPNWSPDGSKIAFVNTVGSKPDIFTVAASGGSVTNVTNTSNANEYGPDWSPDGSRIIFTSDEGTDEANYNLWTMDADGSDQDQVTTAAGFEFEPTWSPEGDRLAFVRDLDGYGSGTPDLVHSAVDGTDVLVIQSAAVEDFPTWQPLGGGGPQDPFYPRSVSLSLKPKPTKLVAKGVIEVFPGDNETAEPGCASGIEVAIQKKSSTGFKTVATAITDENGAYTKKIAKKKGKYRAFLDEEHLEGATCSEAVSAIKTFK